MKLKRTHSYLSYLPVTEASISWFALMTDSELGCEWSPM